MSYENFNDSDGHIASETNILFAKEVFSKFCYYGLVGSNSWDITFLIIIEGVLRIYDTKETYENSPEEFVTQIELTRQHTLSGILIKDYSKNSQQNVFIHYCYLLSDNGLWSPTKIIKVGCSTRPEIENFVAAMKQAIPK